MNLGIEFENATASSSGWYILFGHLAPNLSTHAQCYKYGHSAPTKPSYTDSDHTSLHVTNVCSLSDENAVVFAMGIIILFQLTPYIYINNTSYTVVMTLAFLYQVNSGFSPLFVSVPSTSAHLCKNSSCERTRVSLPVSAWYTFSMTVKSVGKRISK